MEYKKRQTAYKIRIKDIVESEFVKGIESVNFIKSPIGKVSRVNVIGIIVASENSDFYGGAIIDDGTGRISTRSFENKEMFNSFEVGSVINIVGVVRIYGEQKYVSAELVKSVDKIWLEHRKKELEVLKNIYKMRSEDEVKQGGVKEEVVISKKEVSDVEQVCSLIKRFDSGEGVEIHELVEKSNVVDCEKIISELLKNGDVFEIRPGRIKILE